MSDLDAEALRARIASLSPEERGKLFARIASAQRAPKTPPTEVAAEAVSAPLTPGQEHLWILAQDPARSRSYHRLLAIEIESRLDVAALTQALSDIIWRHEILRSRFRVGDSGLEQVVVPGEELNPRVVDLSEHIESARQEALPELARALVDEPFDLAKQAPIRCRIAKLSDSSFVLLLCIHHIAADAWSDGVLMREFSARYTTALGIGSDELPNIPLQYSNFARRKHAEAHGHDWQESIRFWCDELAPPLPRLPEHRIAQSSDGRRDFGTLLTRAVPAALAASAQSMATRIGATPFAVWLAAYAAALRGIYGDELLVSTPTAGRNRVELEPLVGYFVQPILLRLRLDRTAFTFRELVTLVQRKSMDCLAHKEIPDDRLAGVLREHGASVTETLAVAGFAFQSVPMPTIKRPGFSARALRIDPGTAKSPVTLYVWDDGDQVSLGLEHSRDALNPTQAAGLLRAVLSVMETALADPDQRLAPPPGSRNDFEEVYQAGNLTRTQLLIWIDQRLRPQEPVYNIPVLYTLHAALEPDRFAAAFGRVVKATDALRTRIFDRNGAPRQEITEDVEGGHEFVDVSSAADPRREAFRLAERHAAEAIRLDGRLFESLLIRIGPEEHAWFICCHHIICDGWSIRLLLRRLQSAYLAEPNLEASSPSFLDAVGGQRRAEATQGSLDAKEYWARKLEHRPHRAQLPGKRTARPATRTTFDLGAERSNRLRALVSRADVATGPGGLGILSVLCATVALWRWRMTGATRLLVGTPLHNRRSRRLRETVGVLMDIYPLDIEVRPEHEVRGLLADVVGELMDVVRHRSHTVSSGLGDDELDVLVNYQTISEPDFLGRPFEVEWLHPGMADEALAVQLDDFTDSGSLRLSLDVRCDAFDLNDVTLIGDQLVAALDVLLGDLKKPLSRASFASQRDLDEMRRINEAELASEPYRPVHEYIEQWAREAPDRPALRWKGETITFSMLDRRADALASRLRNIGVRVESRVCVYLPRGPEMVIAVLGVLKAGGAYVPIDADYPRQRLQPAVDDVRPDVVVSSRSVLSDRSSIAAAVIYVEESILEGSSGGREPAPRPAAGNLAYIVYTSGSTGDAKGCMNTHGGLHNSYVGWGRRLDLREVPARHLQMASLSFDVFTSDLISTLCFGNTLVICPRDVLVDPARLIDLIATERITHAEFVPSVLRPLATYAERTGRHLHSMRILSVGSEAWSWSDHQSVAALCDPSARLANSYGLSESTVANTLHYLDIGSTGAGGRTVPIGLPFANQRVYVLDTYLEPLPFGGVGELYIGGPSVGAGYWAQGSNTAERFLPDPFAPTLGARMLRTGDRVRFGAGGSLEYLGRTDDQVKVDGVRVEPGEVEAAIRQHEEVSGAAVTVVERGAGRTGLVAYVVPNDERCPTTTALRRFLSTRVLPALVPFRFVQLKALPLNASGKLSRSDLPDPESCPSLPEASSAEPRTDAERAVAQIWQELLGRHQIDRDETFFEAGGSSLALVRAQQLIEAHFDRPVPISVLFQYSTVSALARHLVDQQDAASDLQEPERPAPPESRLARRRYRLREGR